MNNVIMTVLGIMLAGSTATMTASYAGDALKSGASRTVAAGAVTAAVQVIAAVQLHDAQEGTRFEGPSLNGLIESGYLRSSPPNPARAGDISIATDGEERMVVVPIGDDAKDVCAAVDRMSSPGVGCSSEGGRGAVLVRI
jgi:hypothetical protein